MMNRANPEGVFADATNKAEHRFDALEAEKSKIVNYLITAIALALAPISVLILYFAFRSGWSNVVLAQLAIFGVIGLLALKKRFLSTLQRAFIIIAFLMIVAISEVFRFGLLSPTFPLLVVIPVLGAAIGGARWGLVGLGTVVVALISLAWFVIASASLPPLELSVALVDIENWALLIVNIVVATGIGIFVVGSLHDFHVSANLALRERNRELKKSRSRNAQSAKLAGLGHAVTNQLTGQILECDAQFAQMHGLTVDEFVSLDIGSGVIGKLVHEDDRDAALTVRQRLISGEPVVCELRHRLRNGEIRHLRKIFAPIPSADPAEAVFNVVSQDVSEERELLGKLFQAQKLDAIGKLTGGVAHDFNNLLAVILGNFELLNDEITNADHQKLIQNGIDATLRGSELTRNMLSFAQQAQLAPTLIDLNQLVRNLNTWIGRTLPSTIDLETSLLAGLWLVEVDTSSAESALLNLILNARDSMPDGGKLTIETSNVRIDDEYPQLQGENIEPGRYVLLAVSDTGHGISADVRKMIFEPFFTTKPVGSGTGLGLSMLDGFMRQSNGAVSVYSEPGVGSTFKLYFVAAKEDGKLKAGAIQPETEALNQHGDTTILLVEDNADVLATIRAALAQAGFHVLEARSGDEALDIFEQTSDIDLLLTDIVMPGEIQGTTLAEAVRARQPDLPVVFMSGYTNEAMVHGHGLQPEDHRLMKPVRRTDLMKAIDKALAREIHLQD